MEQIIAQITGDPAFAEGQCWKLKRHEENETIIREGEVGKKLYLVQSGSLRISARVRIDGERSIQPGLSELSAGDIVGELSLFSSQPRTASVITLSPCTLIELDCNALALYLDQHPQIGYQFLKELFKCVANRLSLASERVEHLLAWGLKAHRIDRELSD